jgi:hypothetical protein
MDLQVLIAAAADVCLKPQRHAVVPVVGEPNVSGAVDLTTDDAHLRIESRDPGGDRRPELDLELEIYRSGTDLHLMLSWWQQDERPLLWQGSHPVWMDGSSGQRCERPCDGAPLEALARRLRALLAGGGPGQA